MKIGKIVYISYDGMTDSLGESQVLSYLTRIAKNYSVDLISFEKKERNAEMLRIHEICIENDITWRPFSYTKYPKVLSTLYDMTRVFFYLVFMKKKKKIICHARSYIPGIIALYLKKLFHMPFVFDMRGWLIDENLERGSWIGLSYTPIVKVLRYYEKAMIKNADVIISLTDCAKEVLIEKYDVAENKISIIPTCVDFKRFHFSDIERSRMRADLKISAGTFLLIYSGSVGGYYNTEQMISFFKCLKEVREDSMFLFLTKTSSKEIYKFVPEGLKSSIIVVETELRNVYKYLSAADAGLVLYNNTFSGTGRSPTKLAEYWATGLRAFCPRNIGDLNKFYEDDIGGEQFESFKDAHYLQSIKNFLDKQYSREMVISKSKIFFDVDWGSNRYDQIYENIFKSRNSN